MVGSDRETLNLPCFLKKYSLRDTPILPVQANLEEELMLKILSLNLTKTYIYLQKLN